MLENRDYVIIDPKEGYEDNNSLATIRLIDGNFMGTEYSYGVVNMNPDDDNDHVKVSFEYHIHTDNKEQILSDVDIKEDFEYNVSQVLNAILVDTIEKAEERYNDELRKENT
jgi:hypothetical protein